jgi:hypothetical protein
VNQWFVYQGEGSHVGPVSTDLLVRGITAGRVPKDAHVAMAGSSAWAPLMTIEEIVVALGVANDDAPPNSLELVRVAPTRVPPDEIESEADPTEVIRRDEMLKAGMALKARSPSGGPPKPPMLVRASLPPGGQSSAPPPLRPSGSMAIAPSKPAMVAAKPVSASIPPPPPPPPPVPPPPNTMTMLQPQPVSVAPPPVAVAPVAAAAPAVADAPKKPVVDPKLALWLPLATFGLFVFLSLIVVAISFVKRP